jgi:hypothetical protein
MLHGWMGGWVLARDKIVKAAGVGKPVIVWE